MVLPVFIKTIAPRWDVIEARTRIGSNWLHLCWWRMLETTSVCLRLYKKSPTLWFCHSQLESVTNITMLPTSLSNLRIHGYRNNSNKRGFGGRGKSPKSNLMNWVRVGESNWLIIDSRPNFISTTISQIIKFLIRFIIYE